MTVEDILIRLYAGNGVGINASYRRHRTPPPHVFMEVPINNGISEIPLLVYATHIFEGNTLASYDSIVIKMGECRHVGQFRTIDANIRNTIGMNTSSNLAEICCDDRTYYVSRGTIFDNNMIPVMMLSWQIQNIDGTIKCIAPIMRLSPECFKKDDSMRKYLCGKFLDVSATTCIPTDIYGILHHKHIKIEVDDSPFYVHPIEVPSIDTTNEELLQLAADHAEEFL